MRERLQAALTVAMRARDVVAVSALRTALGAIANAEAVQVGPTDAAALFDGPIAGAVAGLGAGDVPRRALSEDDVREIVRRHVSERRELAAEFERAGRRDQGERLRAEADALLDAAG